MEMMKPGSHVNTWGEILNNNLASIHAAQSDMITHQQMTKAIADAMDSNYKKPEPPVEIGGIVAAGIIGTAVAVNAANPVSRRSMFGWLRK